MDVKVELGLSKGLESIANRLINAIEGISSPYEAHADVPGQGTAPELKMECINKVESVSDVEMAQPVEDAPEVTEDADTAVDYSVLRKDIKHLGIKLVQAKKQKDVKALTAKYGYSKMDELPDDKLEAYLEELKEL